MAIIKTYPLKSNYYGPDRLILSDMQPDDQGVVHGTTKSLTLSSLKSFIGSGAAVLQLTTQNTSGAATFDVNTNTLNVPVYTGDTYDLTALQKSGTSVPLKLNAASGTDSQVSFTEGANITLTRNSAEEITISATGGNAGVGSITNAFGTYITGTTNTAATGAVGLGTINLSASDGTSIATTRFLSKDNTWDIISAAGSNTQFQYNNNGAFAATSLMVVTGNDEIQIGQQTNEQGKLIVSGQAAGTSGLIKIEGKSARGVTFSVQPETNVNYDVIFPETGPGGNNKILESDSSGNLAWINTPTGINVVGNPSGTASADLSKITIGSTIYAIPTQGLTSVGLSAPPAFSVTGSPLTSNGSISIGVTGGTAGEFLAHNGQWATPPQGTITAVSGQSGISGSGTSGSVVLTNSDRGSTAVAALNFFKTIATPTNNVVASGNDDTVTLAAGNNTGIFINGSGSQVTIGLSAPTVLDRGGVKLVNATQQSTAANGLTTTAGRTYAIQLNSSGQAVVNVPWSGGSGGGISFSGTTVGGLATYTNSSTAGVSSKVTLNASGLIDLDADGNSAASIDYNPTGNRLQIGDFQSQGAIVELYTNGNKQFQIGVNGEIGLGTGSSQGTSGQVLMSQGNGSAPIWSVVSGGTTPGGASGNIQYNNGSGVFAGSSSFSWELSGGAAGVGKLVIGKPTTPQFNEGVIRLLGDGAGNTGGTIELQAAQGKQGGAANTFKIQAPVSTDTQTLILPEDIPTAEGDVLMIDTITNTEIQTKWDTAGGQTYTSGTGITINSSNQISNTDLGSSQFIFKKIGADQGQSDIIASSNNDIFKVQGGTGISVSTNTTSKVLTINSTGTGSSNIGFQCFNMYESPDTIPKSSQNLTYVRMMVVPQDTSPVNRVDFFCTNIGTAPGGLNPGLVQVSVFRSSALNPTVLGTCVLLGEIDSSAMVANTINTISFAFENDPISYSFSSGDRIAVVFGCYNGAKVAGNTIGLANDGLSRTILTNPNSVPLPELLDDLASYLSDNNITEPNGQHAALTFWSA